MYLFGTESLDGNGSNKKYLVFGYSMEGLGYDLYQGDNVLTSESLDKEYNKEIESNFILGTILKYF